MINWKATNEKIQEFIDKEMFRGAVICVYKDKEEIYKQSFGMNDYENEIRMEDDNIFRAYSMTKPLTVLAFLTLVEKGIVNINDPVWKYIPEFKKVNVLNSIDSKDTHIIQNDLLIKHLLTMTSGLTYFGNKNETQIQTTKILANWANVNEKGEFQNLQEFCRELASIPLLFEPGTSWNYGLSLDVLGGVIEIASKKSFRDYVKENVLDPIGMVDSDFYVKNKKREAKIYQWKNINDKNVLTKDENYNFLIQRRYEVPESPMGGAGIFTTASDYSKFLNVLIDGKTIEGTEIISSKLLKEMKSDQLKELRKYFRWTLNKDYSYGYGIRIRMENESFPKTEFGEVGWDGLLGSTGLVDTKNKITMTLMLSSNPGHNKIIESEFFEAFYSSINFN